MGSHINKDGEFQSDKVPECPPGWVPLKLKDETAQDLLWEYAQRRREVDAEFSDDLEMALEAKGFQPPHMTRKKTTIWRTLFLVLVTLCLLPMAGWALAWLSMHVGF